MTKYLTIGIVHAVFFGLVAYDIWVAIEPSPRDTLSKVGLDGMIAHPSIAILAGIVVGHIAWPMSSYGEVEAWKYTTPVLGALWIGAVVADLLGALPRAAPISYLAAGAVLGHFLWAQRLVGGGPN
jgi:hypothetical protein